MKTCVENGCDRPQFGGLRCSYHQFRRYMRGGDRYKEKQAKIPKRTKKRSKDERYYAVRAREFFDEAVKNKTNFCFFCNKEVKTLQGLHHLDKRDGSKLLDFNLIVIVHNECHCEKYHYAHYEQRVKESWWLDFLERLKERSETLYLKEIKKGEKVNKLNPTINFDEDDTI